METLAIPVALAVASSRELVGVAACLRGSPRAPAAEFSATPAQRPQASSAGCLPDQIRTFSHDLSFTLLRRTPGSAASGSLFSAASGGHQHPTWGSGLVAACSRL